VNPQAQLELEMGLPSYPLTERLYAAGLPRAIPVITHANRRVLLSLTVRGALRVHLGYGKAPDAVLEAIATWARPRIPARVRRAAQRVLTAFPVHQHVPPLRARRPVREPLRPGDEKTLARLRGLHAELNQRHFAGALGEAALVLSARMRRRLGEFRPADGPGGTPEIRISRRHLRRDGWTGAGETLLHEMVHQWQAETGRRLGHGAEFRRVCDRVGIDRRAVRRDDLPRPGP